LALLIFALGTLGAAEEVIKIGLFVPLTGFAAADGHSALAGAQIAVDLINAAGGINGQMVELVYYDDAARADQASAIARKLIEQDQVVIGISGSYSTPTRAAAAIFQQAGVPMISAYAIHPSIIETGHLIFRVGMGAPVEGIAGGHLAVEKLGAQRIAILTMDNDFGVSLSEYFKETVLALGAEIVFEKRYSLGESEFREVLSSMWLQNPDLIWATAYCAGAANIVSQARELGITATILGQEGYDSPKFIELAGEAAEGVIIVTDLNRDSDRPVVQQFLQEFQARAGIPADMVGASAYDAVKVAAYALAQAGTDPEGIAAAINAIRHMEDVVTGPFYTFLGREAIRPVEVQIVRDGAFHFFHTYTDPEIIIPPGL
jgi:branched-chain amino acid transport system substrate-binding protein